MCKKKATDTTIFNIDDKMYFYCLDFSTNVFFTVNPIKPVTQCLMPNPNTTSLLMKKS